MEEVINHSNLCMKNKSDYCRDYWKTEQEVHPEKPSKSRACRNLMADFPDLFIDFEDVRRLMRQAIKNKSATEIQQERDLLQYRTPLIETNKKEKDFHWTRVVPLMQAMQKMSEEMSSSQNYGTWKIETDEPICIVGIGDTQLGSWGTDYNLFTEMTKELIETPNLYAVLLGDLNQMAIQIKQGISSLNDNLMPPKWQIYFLESWLQDVKHKIIASTWDNHSVMREEAAIGYSIYAEIFKRVTIYTNGIGHIDLTIGDQVYKLAISHFFRGKSFINRVHAPVRYLTHEGQDRDIAMQGDYHEPGITKFHQSGRDKVAMVCGSIQTDSPFAKRFFSLKTCPVMPCFVLDPKEKMITPYWSVKEWLKANPPKNKL